MLIWNSPSRIASLVGHPVSEVWRVVESLGIQPVAIINGVAHFDREATERIEAVFEQDIKPIVFAAVEVLVNE